MAAEEPAQLTQAGGRAAVAAADSCRSTSPISSALLHRPGLSWRSEPYSDDHCGHRHLVCTTHSAGDTAAAGTDTLSSASLGTPPLYLFQMTAHI